jgi:hypothetical protein
MQALKNLQAHEIDKFKADALDVYKRAIQYLTQWFDFENSPFRLFAALKLNDNFPTIQELMHVAEIVGVKVNFDELYDELRTLRTASNFLDSQSLPVSSVQKWRKYLQKADSPNIRKIVQVVFAIPPSNAFVERVFSIMNNLWTDERNRLNVDTIKAELCIRHNLNYTCSEFFRTAKNDHKLLPAAHCNEKYVK